MGKQKRHCKKSRLSICNQEPACKKMKLTNGNNFSDSKMSVEKKHATSADKGVLKNVRPKGKLRYDSSTTPDKVILKNVRSDKDKLQRRPKKESNKRKHRCVKETEFCNCNQSVNKKKFKLSNDQTGYTKNATNKHIRKKRNASNKAVLKKARSCDRLQKNPPVKKNKRKRHFTEEYNSNISDYDSRSDKKSKNFGNDSDSDLSKQSVKNLKGATTITETCDCDSSSEEEVVGSDISATDLDNKPKDPKNNLKCATTITDFCDSDNLSEEEVVGSDISITDLYEKHKPPKNTALKNKKNRLPKRPQEPRHRKPQNKAAQKNKCPQPKKRQPTKNKRPEPKKRHPLDDIKSFSSTSVHDLSVRSVRQCLLSNFRKKFKRRIEPQKRTQQKLNQAKVKNRSLGMFCHRCMEQNNIDNEFSDFEIIETIIDNMDSEDLRCLLSSQSDESDFDID